MMDEFNNYNMNHEPEENQNSEQSAYQETGWNVNAAGQNDSSTGYIDTEPLNHQAWQQTDAPNQSWTPQQGYSWPGYQSPVLSTQQKMKKPKKPHRYAGFTAIGGSGGYFMRCCRIYMCLFWKSACKF